MLIFSKSSIKKKYDNTKLKIQKKIFNTLFFFIPYNY